MEIKQDEKDEYIINIISNNMFQFSHFDIYNPIIYNEKIKYSNAKKLKFFDNNYFQIEKDFFVYEHNSDEKLVLEAGLSVSVHNNILFILTENNENIKTFFLNYDNDSIKINIEKKGKYYFEFISQEKGDINLEFIFRCNLFNKIIDEIDFNKNNYFGFYQRLKSDEKNNKDILSYYKISNLTEDKKVYFIYGDNIYNINPEYYSIYFSLLICNLKNNSCVENQSSYLFLKGIDYKIYIYLFGERFANRLSLRWEYSFFPVYENTTQKIKESGYFSIDSPKIFIIEENKEFYFDSFNVMPFYISDDGKIISEIKEINHKDLSNGINAYSFYLEKDDKYRNILFVPENTDKLKQIFITNNKLKISNYTQIKKGENYLINLYYFGTINNDFEIYSSNENNLRIVNFEKNVKNKNYIFFDYLRGEYLYIDKSDRNTYIKKKSYPPKYAFFTILNDKAYYNLISFFIKNDISINSRLNTDRLSINDLFNIYIDELDEKCNLYIKKYYGPIQLYESEYKLNDIQNNIDILTKPINNLTNKKSAFNRLIQLSKNQLITGYLSTDSLVDIYLEKDNDNKDIYSNDFKNRKYIKKGIEYQIHFFLNHLIKLEPQFNAEVVIYNYDTKIILNNKNQTGIVIGNEFKIITNESAMIYFYPKTNKFQKKLLPKKGEIVEILYGYPNLEYYAIDFGFDGYEPPNIHYHCGSKKYYENVYEKLDINLTEGEYLYIYYDALREDCIKINYINDSIISSDYKYNLYHLKQNETKKFILSNKIDKSIKFKIRQYKTNANSLFDLKINDGDSNKKFYKEIIEIYYIYRLSLGHIYKLSFESQNDLILSYSYEDQKDESLSFSYYINEWAKGRKVYKNLFINDIKIINNNLIKINFNPNYKDSLTKYIIIISPEETNNEINNINNELYLIDLINNKEKEKEFIIEEYYDIGENDFIEAIIDITKLKNKYKKFIVNIISQEIRFSKDFNFYKSKNFELKNNCIKNICLIIGVVLFLIFVYVFVYKHIKKTHKKINLKKEKFNKFATDFEFGTELNDSKEFLVNKN